MINDEGRDMLNWSSETKYTEATTDTHLYRVIFHRYEVGQLIIWEYDDNAPYGKRTLLNEYRSSFTAAQREAQAFADKLENA